MIVDAVTSFVATGSFYWKSSLSTATINSMYATYPSSDWTEALCEDWIAGGNEGGGVELEWTFNAGRSTLLKQCAYKNGILLDEDTFDPDLTDGGLCGLTGSNAIERECDFHDDDDGTSNNDRKRLYCVRQQRCTDDNCTQATFEEGLTVTRCITGLAFDGRPADFTPEFGRFDGISFSWLDTNLDEVGFRIFRGALTDDPSSARLGQLIADIPIDSRSCGQQFNPVQFRDRDTGAFPATRVSYLVAVVTEEERDNGRTRIQLGNFTKITYTSPWSATLQVNVESPSNQPVQDVDIQVEHLLTANGSNFEPNDDFLLELVTNGFGSVVHEIFVTDPTRWGTIDQNLRITPSKCDGFRLNGTCCDESIDGETCTTLGLEHEFDPPSEIVHIRHLFEEAVEFVDISARSVVAYVLFGESSGTTAASFDELFGADWLDADACLEFYDKLDDRCYCSVPDVVIEFEAPDGNCTDEASDTFEDPGCDRVTSDASGQVSHSVDLGQTTTVKFGGYLDHLFEIWLITETLGTYERIAEASLKPEATFVDVIEDVRIAFVDATRANLSASVLGGDRQVEFLTGQRLLVTPEDLSCGYNRQLVTYRGHVSPVVMPAFEASVEIPEETEDDAPEDCGLDVRPGSESEAYACRVPAPLATNDDTRLACADADRLKFAYVDEYFADRSGRVETANLSDTSQGDFNVSFTYTAPLCIRTVEVGPTDSELNPFRDLVTPTSRRDWQDFEDEALLLVDPEIVDGDNIFGTTCVDNDRTVFVEDDQVTIRFELVEVYPNADSTCEYPWDYDDEEGCTLALNDADSAFARALSDPDPDGDAILITYLDGITGTDVLVDAETYVADPPNDYTDRFFEVRPGFELNATAGDPTPFSPFTVDVTVIFERDFDGSYLSFDRSAIILGVISEDVPQTIPVSTDPTLIFSILRDPPGGTSRAVIAQGTEIKTSFSIEGMHAGQRSKGVSTNKGAGLSADVGALTAPMGFGLDVGILALGFNGANAYGGVKPSVTASRADSHAIDVTFTFDTEIATSSSPWQAGQASDLILGGGMNLHIQRAIVVEATRNTTTGEVCIAANLTSEWLLPSISTYLLSVFEIEELIEKLAYQYSLDGRQESLDGIENWRKVLRNYRRSTRDSSEAIETVVTGILDHLNVVLRSLEVSRRQPDEGLGQLQDEFLDAMDDPNSYEDFLENGLDDLESLGFDRNRPAAGNLRDFDANDRVRLDSYINRLTRKLDDFTDIDCDSGNAFGLGDLCETKANLATKVSLAKNLLGICDFDEALDGQDEYAPIHLLCATRSDEETKDEDGATILPSSAFDFLDNPFHVLTFSGGGNGLSMTYDIAQSEAMTHQANVEAGASNEYTDSFGWCSEILRRRLGAIDDLRERRRLDAEESAEEEASEESSEDPEEDKAKPDKNSCRKLLLKTEHGESNTFGDEISVSIGRSNERTKGHSQTVTVEFGDDDEADVFAVKVSADKHYGTPIFETIGGDSSCPGETGTSKLDSAIIISEINFDRCQTDLCQNEPYGEPIVLGAVVQNLSPWGFESNPGRTLNAYKVLPPPTFSTRSFTSDPGAGIPSCGEAGHVGGLVININERDNYLFPYGQSEVELVIETRFGKANECLEYIDLPVTIVSNCEYNTLTYQYRTDLDETTNEVSVVHPVFDNQTLAFVEETLAHFPDRYSSTPTFENLVDSKYTRTFSIGWAQSPTPGPTIAPRDPTSVPTSGPTEPTSGPTVVPTVQPSALPTPQPTLLPTTAVPSLKPTDPPSTSTPSASPTPKPTITPTQLPTPLPSMIPYPLPSPLPSTLPIPQPTYSPTTSPAPTVPNCESYVVHFPPNLGGDASATTATKIVLPETADIIGVALWFAAYKDDGFDEWEYLVDARNALTSSWFAFRNSFESVSHGSDWETFYVDGDPVPSEELQDAFATFDDQASSSQTTPFVHLVLETFEPFTGAITLMNRFEDEQHLSGKLIAVDLFNDFLTDDEALDLAAGGAGPEEKRIKRFSARDLADFVSGGDFTVDELILEDESGLPSCILPIYNTTA